MQDNKPEVLICDCHSTDHQMILLPMEEKYGDITEKIVYVHVHLAKKPFWERVQYALKYIFGYQCAYGAFDEILITKNNIDKLDEIVKYIKE